MQQIESLKAQLMALADLVSSVSSKEEEPRPETRQQDDSDDSDMSEADEDGSDDDEEENETVEEDEDEESDGEDEALRTLDPEELVILRTAGVLPHPRQTSKRWDRGTKNVRHIVFVDDEKAGKWMLKLSCSQSISSVPLSTQLSTSPSRSLIEASSPGVGGTAGPWMDHSRRP